MKFFVCIVFLALFSHGVFSATLCDKYATALNISDFALVQTVVNQTLASAANVSNGIAFYFNGSIAGTPNYLGANPAPLNALRASLVAFFGQPGALNCTDNSSNFTYTGTPMQAAHSPYNITFHDYYIFNTALIGNMLADGVTVTDATAVAKLIDTFRYQVCQNPKDCLNICNNYTIPAVMNSNQLVSAVVNGTVNLALASPQLVVYFNGQKGGRPNYTNASDPNAAAQFAALFNHLVQFFAGALGCTDGTVSAWGGNLTIGLYPIFYFYL